PRVLLGHERPRRARNRYGRIDGTDRRSRTVTAARFWAYAWRMTTSRSGYDISPLGEARITALAADLTPEERHVILHQGTERPGCGIFLDNKKPGVYTCRLCGRP